MFQLTSYELGVLIGARLREQLESDSEPDDDIILYGKVERVSESSSQRAEEGREGLDEEDLFAQERGTLQFDGDIKVCANYLF